MSYPKACASSGLKTADTVILTNDGMVCGVDLVNNGGNGVVEAKIHNLAADSGAAVGNMVAKLSLAATNGAAQSVDFPTPIACGVGILLKLTTTGVEAEAVVRYIDLKLGIAADIHG